MFQFLGSILDSLLMIGFGALAVFQPHKLTRKGGTPEQVQKRIRLMKLCGGILALGGVALLVEKFVK